MRGRYKRGGWEDATIVTSGVQLQWGYTLHHWNTCTPTVKVRNNPLHVTVAPSIGYDMKRVAGARNRRGKPVGPRKNAADVETGTQLVS